MQPRREPHDGTESTVRDAIARVAKDAADRDELMARVHAIDPDAEIVDLEI